MRLPDSWPSWPLCLSGHVANAAELTWLDSWNWKFRSCKTDATVSQILTQMHINQRVVLPMAVKQIWMWKTCVLKGTLAILLAKMLIILRGTSSPTRFGKAQCRRPGGRAKTKSHVPVLHYPRASLPDLENGSCSHSRMWFNGSFTDKKKECPLKA